MQNSDMFIYALPTLLMKFIIALACFYPAIEISKSRGIYWWMDVLTSNTVTSQYTLDVLGGIQIFGGCTEMN
jgi:hypothetical protein